MESLNIDSFLSQVQIAPTFRPYSRFNREADALTFYFKGDRDYSQRLNDHVTLFLSIETNELVGCRVKGVSGILEDLPNYLKVEHEKTKLSILFFAFRGSADDDGRKALNDLARASDDLMLDEAGV